MKKILITSALCLSIATLQPTSANALTVSESFYSTSCEFIQPRTYKVIKNCMVNKLVKEHCKKTRSGYSKSCKRKYKRKVTRFLKTRSFKAANPDITGLRSARR